MTYRERKEARLAKRQEWAENRERRANATLNSNPELRHDWAFITQPGHIPERARMNAADDRACASLKVAADHRAKAAGIADQLDRSIYSDDTDAVEALEARIAENEATRAHWVTVNKLYRKGDSAGLAALGLDLDSLRTKLKDAHSWCQQPYPGYTLSNLGGRITADRKRLSVVKARQQRTANAEAAGGVLVEYLDGYEEPRKYARVTFTEKPDRSTIDALKAAGYRWGGGSWCGNADQLPACVVAS